MSFKHYAFFVLFFASILTAYTDEYGIQSRNAQLFALADFQNRTSSSAQLTTEQQTFAQIVPWQMVEKFFATTKKLTFWQYTFDKAFYGMQVTVGIDPRSLYNIAYDIGVWARDKANEAQTRDIPLNAEKFIWQHWASYCLKEHGITQFDTVTPENYLQLFTPEMRQACFKKFDRYQFPAYRDFLKTLPGHEEFMFNLPHTGMNEIHQQLHALYPSDKELDRIWGSINAAAKEVEEKCALQRKMRLKEEERQAVIQKNLESAKHKQQLAEQEKAHQAAIADGTVQIFDAHPLIVARHGAVNNFVADNDMQVKEGTYDLDKECKSLLLQQGVPIQFFTEFKGFEVQHALHAEYIAMLNEAKDIKDKRLKDVVVEGIIVGTEANKLGYLPISCQIADFCHSLIGHAKTGARICTDFAVGTAQGAWHSVQNITHALAHPIDTVTAVAKGTAWLGKEMAIMLKHSFRSHAYRQHMMIAYLRSDWDTLNALKEQFEREEVPYNQACNEALNRRVDLFLKASAQEKGELFGRFAADMYFAGRIAHFTSKISALTQSTIADIAQRVKTIRLAEATLADARFAKKATSGLASETATTGGPSVGPNKINMPGYDWPMPTQLAESISRINPYFQVVMEDVMFVGKEFIGTSKGFSECANKFVKFNYKHLFSLEFNVSRKGKPKIQGFHHDMHGVMEKSGEITLVNKVTGKFGCYEAEVQVAGAVSKPGKTFFPQSWSRRKVIEKIHEAFENFKKSGMQAVKENNQYTFRGLTNEGMQIEFCMTEAGEIKTCYPIFETL